MGCRNRLKDRLAAYEDTGLEPCEVEVMKTAMMGKSVAEIKEFDRVPIDHLRELVQAEQDGRLAVLPCKVGTNVWIALRGEHENYVEKGCVEKFGCLYDDRIDVTEWYSLISIIEVFGPKTYHYSIDSFGKTVFLTREEAEAALEKSSLGEGVQAL